MKALDTFYNEKLFRSKLEAQYAVFLNELGEKWEYEERAYDLDDGDRYRPDFWLPRLEMFLEVKGGLPNEREIRVARKLQFFTGHDVLICSGYPLEREGRLFGWSEQNGGRFTEEIVQWAYNGALYLDDGFELRGPKLCQARIAALIERFDYGRVTPRVVNYDSLPF